MTTFEITIIVLLATIVVLLIVLLRTAIEGFHGVWQNQSYNYNELRKIVVSTSETLSDISMQLDNIEKDILDESVGLPAICKKLDDLRIVAPELQGMLSDLAINSKGHYNELQQLREEIYSKRYLLGLDTEFPPCYAPNGICTNPQMDCINCPKRGTGGFWTTNTSIKAEDAPLQERFNDNKED